MQYQSTTTTGKAIIPAHRDARFNRTWMAACFLFFAEQPDITRERHAAMMRAEKERIRQHDAEPPAWFNGPTRADWVRARLDAGEKMTDEEIGRALRPD